MCVCVLQVPVIAIAGSGGGFRAMVGFSGVMKALFESGVLDCATYVAGLSGSTWSVFIFSSPVSSLFYKTPSFFVTSSFLRDILSLSFCYYCCFFCHLTLYVAAFLLWQTSLSSSAGMKLSSCKNLWHISVSSLHVCGVLYWI